MCCLTKFTAVLVASRNTTRSNYSIKRELSAQIEREFVGNLDLEDEETLKINRNYLLSPFRSGIMAN